LPLRVLGAKARVRFGVATANKSRGQVAKTTGSIWVLRQENQFAWLGFGFGCGRRCLLSKIKIVTLYDYRYFELLFRAERRGDSVGNAWKATNGIIDLNIAENESIGRRRN